jgi:hypothetical protein
MKRGHAAPSLIARSLCCSTTSERAIETESLIAPISRPPDASKVSFRACGNMNRYLARKKAERVTLQDRLSAPPQYADNHAFAWCTWAMTARESVRRAASRSGL